MRAPSIDRAREHAPAAGWSAAMGQFTFPLPASWVGGDRRRRTIDFSAFASARQMKPRLPSPYREEAPIVGDLLQSLSGGLDWPAAAAQASPWVQAVRFR